MAGVAVPAKDFIVKGKNTVEDKDMPFVNRLDELWQLFEVNANNLVQIISSEKEITNFRKMELLFCVQYFGSGKTTLGTVFESEIHKDRVTTYFAGKLHTNLQNEWDIIKDKGIRRLLIDVRSTPNILLKTAKLASGDDNVIVPDDPAEVARHMVEYAKANGPTLFHFDEVGADTGHDVYKLRQLGCAVWERLYGIKSKEGATNMPRIYFLVSGRSIEPFQNIGHGGCGMGSYFLILDMLKAEHIKAVRLHLQALPPPKNRLELFQLDESQNGDYLDACLVEATGGSPRLLLYALRTLQYSRAVLDSRENIKEAVNNTTYDLLYGIGDVRTEFLPQQHPGSRMSFQILLGLLLQRQELEMTTRIRVGGAIKTVGDLLRFQPFFLSRDDSPGEKFVLHLPLFHIKAAKSEFAGDAVPLLLIAMAGTSVHVNEPWRIFDIMPAHIVASQAAWRVAMVQQGSSDITWANALPNLLGTSQIASTTRFRLVEDQPFGVLLEKARLPEAIEQNPEKYAERGAVLPADKSASADTFFVQRKMDGNGHTVVEWQQKFDVQTVLQMATVRAEAEKCNKSLPTIFIMFAATVGPQLVAAISKFPSQVLVLTSHGNVPAEYVFSSSGELLWRKQQTLSWYIYPDKARVFHSNVTPSVDFVTVRPGLEIVIPHHDVVRQLVGPSRFDSLKDSVKQNASAEATSAVISMLDEALAGKDQPFDSVYGRKQEPTKEQKEEDRNKKRRKLVERKNDIMVSVNFLAPLAAAPGASDSTKDGYINALSDFFAIEEQLKKHDAEEGIGE